MGLRQGVSTLIVAGTVVTLLQDLRLRDRKLLARSGTSCRPVTRTRSQDLDHVA